MEKISRHLLSLRLGKIVFMAMTGINLFIFLGFLIAALLRKAPFTMQDFEDSVNMLYKVVPHLIMYVICRSLILIIEELKTTV